MKFNHLAKTVVATSGIAALALTTAAVAAESKAKTKKKERCYGIVAKGQNDCGTSTHSCAGRAKVDNHPEEWLLLPAGLCERIAGGSLSPKK